MSSLPNGMDSHGAFLPLTPRLHMMLLALLMMNLTLGVPFQLAKSPPVVVPGILCSLQGYDSSLMSWNPPHFRLHVSRSFCPI
jgi:hypothetical protein